MKDWKITAKKAVIIAIVVLICISIARYCVKNTVIDAAVNEQTGAITFLNRDYELKTYDRFGNLIYDTELFNTRGGYAHLDYEDGLLTVYVLRTEEVRKYDENGNLIDQQNESEDSPYAWDTWERDSRSFFFETDTHIYRYTYPSLWRGLLFNDEVVVKIIDKETEEEIVLWK